MTEQRSTWNSRAIRWGFAAVGWTAVALLFATQNYVTLLNNGRYVAWTLLLAKELPTWWLWGLASPLIFLICRRLPIGGEHGWSNVFPHVLTGVLFAALNVTLYIIVAQLIGVGRPILITFGAYVRDAFSDAFAISFVIYCVVVAIHHMIEYYRAYRARELAASRLEARLAQAELDVLRMQLQPHFLFNTLHGISALMARDVQGARRMIARLSDLLRISLERDGAQEIPLDEEIAFLRRYVELQQMRFHDRLTVEIAVDEEALSVPVPRLLLQPIVENAIRHGIASHAAAGRIAVEGHIRQGRLHLAIRDNGPGLPEPGAPRREGVGLGNTRARLEQLYGPGHSFAIANVPEGGAVVEIAIPIHRNNGGSEPA